MISFFINIRNIRFVENPIYNEANNISSAVCQISSAECVCFEADLLLSNKKLIRKYEYETNFLSIPVESTDDWCFATDHNGVITEEKSRWYRLSSDGWNFLLE